MLVVPYIETSVEVSSFLRGVNGEMVEVQLESVIWGITAVMFITYFGILCTIQTYGHYLRYRQLH